MLKKLLRSKAFWTAVISMAVKVVNLFGAMYWPDQVKLINELWLAAQPVVLIIIGVFATDEILAPAVKRLL